MKRQELVRLKRELQQEMERRERINELLKNELIIEFMKLNRLDIQEIQVDNVWLILEEILKDFSITESNGILVCLGNYRHSCRVCYQEYEYEEATLSFDSEYTEYQRFRDIETGKVYKTYLDKYIRKEFDEYPEYYKEKYQSYENFCHERYGRYLTSELKEKYILLNPYNSSARENGFDEVRKDFFMEAIVSGQPKAKQLVLNKYAKMK